MKRKKRKKNIGKMILILILTGSSGADMYFRIPHQKDPGQWKCVLWRGNNHELD